MAASMTSARSLASRPAGTASATTTVVDVSSPSPIITPPSGTLRLRGAHSSDRHIQWAEDVIDNEGMGKKSSKVCCIFHKNRAPDESSSDESSDSSSSDSDSEPDNSRARPVGGARRRQHHHRHPKHDSDPKNASADPSPSRSRASGSGKRKARRPSPNAYERVPKYGKGKAESS